MLYISPSLMKPFLSGLKRELGRHRLVKQLLGHESIIGRLR